MHFYKTYPNYVLSEMVLQLAQKQYVEFGEVIINLFVERPQHVYPMITDTICIK